jgi:L-amino acid N-acyltransferase YncA
MLTVRPITLRAANAFVKAHHRHHGEARGCVFCVSVVAPDGEVRGVAIVSRPVARGLQDGTTAEVVRLCTLGDRNACSMLYSAAWRACRALGYQRLVTYILETEAGISLKGAGWQQTAYVPGRSWTCPSRPRTDKHPTCGKHRWEVTSTT